MMFWILAGTAYVLALLLVWAIIAVGAMSEERNEYRMRKLPDGWHIQVKMPHLSRRGWITAEGPISDHAEAVRVFDHYREREAARG